MCEISNVENVLGAYTQFCILNMEVPGVRQTSRGHELNMKC